jgi:L-histidine Nalpha-methyltransferase
MNALVETSMRTLVPPPIAAAVPPRSAFATAVLEGLAQERRRIPGTWLYDARGAALFDRLAQQPEHYPARNEIELLHRARPHIARACGRHAVVFGLGNTDPSSTGLAGCKAQRLLAALDAPAACAQLDVSRGLAHAAARIAAAPAGQRLLLLAGATIGNVAPADTMALLDRLGQAAGRGALLVVGADATQDPALLLAAYDDRHGAAAAFNRNLLARINRELDGGFDEDAFTHRALWNAPQHRIELHLVARRAHRVDLLGRPLEFAAGESIHTETFHKHTLLRLRALARHAGWAHRDFWMDSVSCFALHLLEYVA